MKLFVNKLPIDLNIPYKLIGFKTIVFNLQHTKHCGCQYERISNVTLPFLSTTNHEDNKQTVQSKIVHEQLLSNSVFAGTALYSLRKLCLPLNMSNISGETLDF